MLKPRAPVAGLWREHHDELARFMAAISPQGAAEAAHLSGLTLTMETHIAMHIGQLRWVWVAEEGPSMPEKDRTAFRVCKIVITWHVQGRRQ